MLKKPQRKSTSGRIAVTAASGQPCIGCQAACHRSLTAPLVVGLLLLTLTPAWAQSLPQQMDLTSAAEVHVAESGGSIKVGDQTRVIDKGATLTAAEALALQQALSGTQTIQLSGRTASGGQFIIDSNFGNVASLAIPGNVTAVYRADALSGLTLTGNLSNAGSLFAVGSQNITTAYIQASNIFNEQGGLISTMLPANLATLFGASSLNLQLSATNSLINYGTISSAGSLSTFAGAQIMNAGTMTAAGAANLTSAIGNIVNAGAIVSSTSNINITGALANNLVITNIAGKLQALDGAVNLTSSLPGLDTSIMGGDILARELNIVAPGGLVKVEVDDLTAIANITARETRITASTENLHLGNVCLTGDPTFFNLTGSIIINTGLVFAGEHLAIVANEDVLTQSGAGRIDTSSSTGSAGDILIAAGARFTVSNPNAGPFDPVNINITGASGTGGKIDLGQATALEATGAINGGNITLVAFEGLNADSGQIIVPGSITTKTGGNGSGTNGNVTVLAGASVGTSISMGAIDTRGGTGGGGSVRLLSINPSPFSGVLVQNSSSQGGFNGEYFSPTTLPSFDFSVNDGTITTGDIRATDFAEVLVGSTNQIRITSIRSAGGVVGIQSDGYPNVFVIGPGATTNGIDSVDLSGTTGGSLILKNIDTVSLGPSKIMLNGSESGGTLQVLNIYDLSFQSGTLNLGATAPASTGGNLVLNDVNYLSVVGGSLSVVTTGITSGGAVDIRTNNAAIAVGFGNGEFSLTTGTTHLEAPPGLTLDFAALKSPNSVTLVADSSIVATGTLDLNGVDTQSGGQLIITASAVEVDLTGATILARGGPNGGDGGIIDIYHTGGTTKLGQLDLSAQHGNGGQLLLRGLFLNIPAGTYAVDGAGGDYHGGTIRVDMYTTITGTGPLILSANGSGAGNGGNIMVYLDTGQELGTGDGEFFLTATGGSPGSLTGNGGTVSIQSSKAVILDPNALNIFALGDNGDGASINVYAPNIWFTDSINVDGKGTGSGGSVRLGGIGTFTIGAGTLTDGVNGTISAKSLNGNGGTVEIEAYYAISLSDSAAINVSGTGDGGHLSLDVSFGDLNFAGNSINVDAGPGGRAGTVALSYDTLNMPSGPLVIRANGLWSGATPNVIINSNNKITVGTNDGDLQISAPAISLRATSLVNITDASLILPDDPTQFQSVNLEAWRVLVNGDLHTFDGPGISIKANTTFESFYVGPSATTNGVTGSLIAERNTAVDTTPAVAITVAGLIVESADRIMVTNSDSGTASLDVNAGYVFIGEGTLSVGGTPAAGESGGVINIHSDYLETSGSSPAILHAVANATMVKTGGSISVSGEDIHIGTTGGTFTLIADGSSDVGGSISVSATKNLFVSTNGIVFDQGGTTGTSLSLSAGEDLVVTGDLDLINPSGFGGAVSLTYNTNYTFANVFTVGGVFTGSGITGSINTTGAPGLAGGNVVIESTPGSQASLVINSSIVTGTVDSGAAHLHFQGANDTELGTVDVTINPSAQLAAYLSVKAEAVYINSSIPVNAGKISGSYDLEITAPSITVDSSLSQIDSLYGSIKLTTDSLVNTRNIQASDNVSIFSPSVFNSGLISAGGELLISHNQGLTVTGNGTMTGAPLNFTSSNGAVNVTQSAFAGPIIGSAPLGWVVQRGSAVTTSQILSQASNSPLLTSEQRRQIAFNLGTTLQPGPLTTVISTDTRPLHFQPPGSQSSDSESSGMSMAMMSVDSGTFMLVTSPNQIVSTYVGDASSYFIADESTLISEEDKVVVLHTGKLVVDTGETPVSVQSPVGKVAVGKNSSVLLEVKSNGRTRVVSLAGANTIEGDNGSSNLRVGDELVAVTREVSQDEFIPIDGIARGEAIDAAITKSGKSIRRQVLLREVIERDIMINGSLLHVGGQKKAIHDRYQSRLRAAADQQPLFRPISFAALTPVTSNQSVNRKQISAPLQLVGAPRSKLHAVDAHTIELLSGAITFRAPHDTKVRTRTGAVLVEKGECVNIEATDGYTKVRACSGVNSVTMRLGEQSIVLSGGQEAIVSQEKPSSEALDDSLGRRDMQVSRWGKAWITRSDFSIVSLINTSKYMRALISPSSNNNRALQAQLLKAAAVLQYVTGSHGPYRSR